MMEEEICFSPYSLNLTTVVKRYLILAIMLAREDIKMHLHTPQAKTGHLWLCVWANCHLKKLHYC